MRKPPDNLPVKVKKDTISENIIVINEEMNIFFLHLIEFFVLDKKGQASVCVNRRDYNGYTYNKFYCPLPASTGMNQLDRYCCGIVNYQYCCNEQFVSYRIFLKLFCHLFFLTENTIEIKPVDLMMVVIIATLVIPEIDITHEQIEFWLLFYQLLLFLLQQER